METLTLGFFLIFFAHVDVTISNQGKGEGQAQVQIRLVDPRTGASYEKEEKIDLEALETSHIVAQIYPRQGQYEAQAEVKFPP